MTHRPPAHLLSSRVRVAVIGCGGTGSAIACGLPYLHQAMIARGHPHGLTVTLFDGDTVSESNTVRQPFCVGEIGHNKAWVLASRLNVFWGLRWKAVQQHVTAREQLTDFDLVIGCVDSVAARAVIQKICTRASSTVRYWLDLGNLADLGQLALGEPLNRQNPASSTRLPTAAELWPELVDTSRPVPNLPSCSAAEALTRQAPFVNQILANHALSLLANLFAGGIHHHAEVIRLTPQDGSNRLASAIRVPSPPPPPPVEESVPQVEGNGSGARARRRARRLAAAGGGQ